MGHLPLPFFPHGYRGSDPRQQQPGRRRAQHVLRQHLRQLVVGLLVNRRGRRLDLRRRHDQPIQLLALDRLGPSDGTSGPDQGNPSATDPSQTPATIVWDCAEDGSTATKVHLWDCPDGSNIFVTLRFPQRWSGVEKDAGSVSMAYSLPTGGCPASNPVMLPALRVRVYYDLTGIEDSSRLRVATDNPSAELGGLTMAGGYIHGWQDGDFQSMVDSCLKALNDCGYNLAAEGQSLALPQT